MAVAAPDYDFDPMEEMSMLEFLPADIRVEISQPDTEMHAITLAPGRIDGFDPMEEISMLEFLPADIRAEISQLDTENHAIPLAVGAIDDIVINIDYQYDDPELALDIYKHCKEYEGKNSPDLEKLRKNINTNKREALVDWIVQTSEKCSLSHETLYLCINYLDRYLSNNAIQMDDELLLLGVACLLIAIKYEEEVIPWPPMTLVLHVTDYTYSKKQMIKMEATILSCLQFNLGATTAQCYFNRFIYAAQTTEEIQSWGVLFEYLAMFLMELSLHDCNMLCYAPSMIAASTVFLAKYILYPNRPPWTATLKYYTEYEPHELGYCVSHLYRLFSWNKFDTIAPATKAKYCHRNYDFVAMVDWQPMVPLEYFL